MATVKTNHKRFLSVADSFKACVSSRNAKKDGGKGLESAQKYITDKIEQVERKVVDSTDIVGFLVAPDSENLADNYYRPDKKTRKIRSAVVKCNFTDSETLMRNVESKCKEHKVERIIVSSHATSVQGVLEEANEHQAKNRHTIVVIEQLESMCVDVFNRLVSLLAYEELNVSLLICICTSRSAFVSHCSMDNRELLYAEFFPLASPQDQFDEVAAALTRNDDKKQTCNLFLSGELLHFLKNRFLLVDFSLSELKKIVRLSILENYLKYDAFLESEDDDFLERLPAYWEWFDTLYELIKAAYDDQGPVPSQIDLHCELQRDPASFWSNNEAVANVKNWLYKMEREDLCNEIDSIAKAVEGVSPEESKALSDLVGHLRAAAAAVETGPSTATPTTPSTPSGAAAKMSMNEFIKHRAAALREKQARGDQQKEVVGEVMRTMRKQVFGWSKYEDYLLMVPEGLEIPDLSKQLMSRTDQSLSHAYTALAGIDQFKAVPMARWGEMVADRMDNGQFYDCVAELERMGAIKDMSRQGKRAVMLQARPMRNFN